VTQHASSTALPACRNLKELTVEQQKAAIAHQLENSEQVRWAHLRPSTYCIFTSDLSSARFTHLPTVPSCS
jgi:hypothetical protein